MKVVIVDDQEIVREGLKMILSLHKEIQIIGEASNGQELLNCLVDLSPEVILMDIRMPVMDGITAAELVKKQCPDTKVIILTTFNDYEYIVRGLRSGVDGYLLKDSGSLEILSAIKAVMTGNVLLTSRVTETMMESIPSSTLDGNSTEDGYPSKLNKAQLAHLTPRELDVARHILSGSSNKGIADSLFVTEGTIKNYVSRILEKLDCKNRTELVIRLGRLGPF
ncbi:response regulator transcription factor [Paenibacillus sp. SN-8-1]|uniref:response regulator transcription factor n=1 Tax=Paenibacillus sp. SN-8-1 TaxID=3435409 RepID=UPI003D9A1A1D